MKSADIPDALVIDLVMACNEGRCAGGEGWHGGAPGYGHEPDQPVIGHWQNRWDLGRDLNRVLETEVPEKVVLAKIEKMIRRGRLNGCGCGCRGDLTV